MARVTIRIDLADPNTDVDNNRVTTMTAVLGFYMSSKAQFRVAYERQSFQATGAPSISGFASATKVCRSGPPPLPCSSAAA